MLQYPANIVKEENLLQSFAAINFFIHLSPPEPLEYWCGNVNFMCEGSKGFKRKANELFMIIMTINISFKSGKEMLYVLRDFSLIYMHNQCRNLSFDLLISPSARFISLLTHVLLSIILSPHLCELEMIYGTRKLPYGTPIFAVKNFPPLLPQLETFRRETFLTYSAQHAAPLGTCTSYATLTLWTFQLFDPWSRSNLMTNAGIVNKHQRERLIFLDLGRRRLQSEL